MKSIYIIYFLLLIIFIAFLGVGLESYTKRQLGEENSVLKNRKSNLDQVTKHYSSVDRDDLKLKAAHFLINNISEHFSYRKMTDSLFRVERIFNEAHDVIISKYFLSHKILKTPDDKGIEKYFENFKLKVKSLPSKNLCYTGVYPDSLNISSTWLIDHIDNAFTVWKTSPLARKLTYEEFLEYILPYRARNEEIDQTHSSVRKYMKIVLADGHSENIHEIVNRLNTYLTYIGFIKKTDQIHADFGFFNPMQFDNLDCGRHSEWSIQALRSCGVPASFDFTPSWLNRNRHHFWVAVRESSGKSLPFTPIWQPLGDTEYYDETSKVYRYTFTPNSNPVQMGEKLANVPAIFRTKFIKDVTQEYHTAKDVTIPYFSKHPKQNIFYIAIFSSSGWKPIGWGVSDSKHTNVTFKNVPVGKIYMFGSFEEGVFSPLGEPVFLTNSGIPKPITADDENRIDVRLERKFHEKTPHIERMEEMDGAVIETSKSSTFSNAKVIYTLHKEMSKMNFCTLTINSKNLARYIRIRAKSGKSLNLASLEVFSQKHCKSDIQASSEIESRVSNSTALGHLSKISVRALDEISDYSNVLDNDMETYVTANELLLKLDCESKIRKIVLAPRNSNNAIVKGHRYELFYYNNGWRSNGSKIAHDEFISFKNIPSKTIYWLRNLDAGVEEQAFIIKNGVQIFINENNYINSKWLKFDELFSKSI